jgi:hypothetical protein
VIILKGPLQTNWPSACFLSTSTDPSTLHSSHQEAVDSSITLRNITMNLWFSCSNYHLLLRKTRNRGKHFKQMLQIVILIHFN